MLLSSKATPGALAAGQPRAPSNVQVFHDLLSTCLNDIERKLGELTSTSDPKKKASLIYMLNPLLTEATKLKKSLGLEISLMAQEDKGPFRQILRGLAARLSLLENQFKAEVDRLEKKQLLSQATTASGRTLRPEEERNVMISATIATQNKIDASLKNAHFVAGQTVHIGNQVLETLEGQTEQIVRVDMAVEGVQGEIKTAKKTLRAILRRVASDKLVTLVSAVMFGLVIVVVALVAL